MPHDTFVRVANGIFLRERRVLLCVLPNLRNGPKAGGERHDSKHPADLSAGPLGKLPGLGVPRDRAECGSGVPSGLEMLLVLPTSDRWAGPGRGHMGTWAPSTSQQPFLQYSYDLGHGLLGRAPRKMDTGPWGLFCLELSAVLPLLRKAGSNHPAPR